MSVTQPIRTDPVPRTGLRWTEFRIIPALEKSSRVVAAAQTPWGRIALLSAFGLGLRVFILDTTSVVLLVAVLGLITFLPVYRRFCLGLFGVWMAVQAGIGQPLTLASTVVTILLGAALYSAAMRWPQSHFGRRPVAFLLAGFSGVLVLASAIPSRSALNPVVWALAGVLSTYIWFIAYVITDRNSKPRQDATLEMTAFHPIWSSTTTPFPKGAANLRKIEAKNPEQLAISQLKGLKLLAWAILIKLLFNAWGNFFHGYLGIPNAEQALAMSISGIPVACHVRWESQLLAFFENIMSISILGHRIIAMCRVAGYNALRNTYRPLSSKTIAEFFNRFYYYFKELLVDFFFYPVFLRYFKKHRRLRLIAANFSAVFFGNAFFHFTRDWQFIRERGLWPALVSFRVYLIYVTALTAAISISQLRKRGPSAKPDRRSPGTDKLESTGLQQAVPEPDRRKPLSRFFTESSSFLRGTFLPISGVLLFYALLELFDYTPAVYPLREYLRYAAGFFFLRI